MDDGTLYRLEVLDFHQGLISGMPFEMRAMPPNVLVVKLPSTWSQEQAHEFSKKAAGLFGMWILTIPEVVEFFRLVEVPALPADEVSARASAGRSVRLVGD